MQLEKEYDLVIVGSGGGSFCAALTAVSLGKRPVILEKQSVVGGSTSYSGGVWWVPNNPLLAPAGVQDSFERGYEYLTNCVSHVGPAVTPERTRAFLRAAPRMLTFLQSQGIKIRRPVDDWPDYYDDVGGGLAAGRSVLPAPFNMHELGEWESKLAMHPTMSMVPLSSDQFVTLFLIRRTWAGKLKALKLAFLMAKDKLLGHKTVCNGAAIQGQMLKAALKAKIPIFPDTPVNDFIVENGRVVGVRATHQGQPVLVRARDAVLADAGGFARNTEMRRRLARTPINGEWSNANPGDTGEILSSMMKLGAATDLLDAAIWTMTSMAPDGTFPKGAVFGSANFPFMHHLDLSLPFSIMVDQDGRRIVNESASYQEVGEKVYDRHLKTGRALPAWVIFDARHRKRYPWGAMPPGVTPREWLDTGYMKKAESLEELARLCGIDVAGLREEVARFNRFAESGVDEDFRRGARVFDRSHGDPTVKPNPSLGPIEQAPFYAVAIHHGDVGTSGGVVTDEYARVKRRDGSVIPGLYAAGNVAASPFGRCYPGAGASISNTFAFGYIAALHSAGSKDLAEIIPSNEAKITEFAAQRRKSV
jgi:3-oxosteroid 1-dehydrogenase